MKNITLAVEDDLLAKTRLHAAEKGTTVNALVRGFLRRLTEDERDEFERQREAREGLLELIRTSEARMGPDYKWSREELYDREALRRHEHPGLRGDGKD